MSEHADYCHIETGCAEPGHCTCLPSWKRRADLIADAKRVAGSLFEDNYVYAASVIDLLVAELERSEK